MLMLKSLIYRYYEKYVTSEQNFLRAVTNFYIAWEFAIIGLDLFFEIKTPQEEIEKRNKLILYYFNKTPPEELIKYKRLILDYIILDYKDIVQFMQFTKYFKKEFYVPAFEVQRPKIPGTIATVVR